MGSGLCCIGSVPRPFLLPLSILCLALCCSFGRFIRTAEAYKNYTVGGDLGWFDKLEKPKVDYQKWADAFNFTLGDFLIFHTDRNHSVVQTYNATTYKSCSIDDALETDTDIWSSSDGPDSNDATINVPLVKEGPNYFFSSDYDGEQCANGQKFQIAVEHGEGLPPSLRPEAPGPAAAGGDDGSAPDTNLQDNFDHPKDVQAVKGAEPSGAAARGGLRCLTAGALVVAVALVQRGAVGWVG